MIHAGQPPAVLIEAAAPEKQQIGSAKMEQDGTIIMMLRLIKGAGVGDAESRYKPSTPEYDRVRTHLRDLRVGHPVPVYNDWPD